MNEIDKSQNGIHLKRVSNLHSSYIFGLVSYYLLEKSDLQRHISQLFREKSNKFRNDEPCPITHIYFF